MSALRAALGAAAFGTTVLHDTAFEILDAFVSLGGRTIDTANNYAYWHPGSVGGDSEAVLGDWLEQRQRSEFTVITKVGSMPLDRDGVRVLEGLSPDAVNAAVAKSLVQLKTDCIDVLLAHHDRPATPLLDTWTAFSELVAAGKARKVGVSNFSAPRLAELIGLIQTHSLAPLTAVQVKYSVIAAVQPSEPETYPPFDEETRDVLRSLSPGTVIYAYSPLLGGLYEKPIDEEWPVEYDSLENRQKVKAIQEQARQLEVSPSAFVLKQIADDGIIPVTSTSKIERLGNNLRLLR